MVKLVDLLFNKFKMVCFLLFKLMILDIHDMIVFHLLSSKPELNFTTCEMSASKPQTMTIFGQHSSEEIAMVGDLSQP